MALIKPLLGELSGSIGGNTFARNKGGQYVRQRAQVTNPNTAAQQAARTALAYLVGYWLSTLTAAQRAAWEAYAENVQVTNRLGEKINISGQNMFVRCNAPRQRAGLAIIEEGPTEYITAELEPVSLDGTGWAGTETVQLEFDDTADWCDTDGASLIVQVSSAPQNATVNFFKGPFVLAGTIDGNSITPPTSAQDIALPYTVAAGQQVFARVRLSAVDGTLSAPQIVACTVTAS